LKYFLPLAAFLAFLICGRRNFTIMKGIKRWNVYRKSVKENILLTIKFPLKFKAIGGLIN